MSIAAMMWALRQRLAGPQDQCLLYVIADSADPAGITRHCDPDYLAAHARMSRASVFRRLNDLRDDGLLETFDIHDARGRRVYEIRLNMERVIDKPLRNRRGDEGAADEGGEGPEPAAGAVTDAPQSHGETVPQSHGETVTVAPVRLSQSHSCDCTSPPLSQESPPYVPPPGGSPARDELFEAFVGAWGEPIPKMKLARAAWDHVDEVKRTRAVNAACGYWTWLRAHTRPPTATSAQAFIRDEAGWAQWLRYLPDASGAAPAASSSFRCDGPEGRAIQVLYRIARKEDFLRSVMTRNGAISYRKPMTPRLAALADAPADAAWVRLEGPQVWRWNEMLREHLTVASTPLREGDRAPWPWPPNRDGTISTGPPEPVMTADDDATLAGEGLR